MGRLFDTKQAAAQLQLHPVTLAAWRVAGRGPRYIKLGRSVRYSEADLARWLAEQTVGATQGIEQLAGAM